MYIKITHAVWIEIQDNAVLYGQNQETEFIICEVTEPIPFEYEEVDSSYNDFKQLCCPPVFKTPVSVAKLKDTLIMLRTLENEYTSPEFETLLEIKLAYENIILRGEVDTLALTFHDIIEV